MARLPRYTLPGQPQHIIQRGNNRCVIFVSDDDYRFYLDCLSDAAKRTGCDVHAYVLMSNHVHLLVTPQHTGSIAKMLQSVGRRYVQHFNQTYQRTGTLWEGRYKATLIDSEAYLLTCYRYIELNPVRAGMVLQAGDYKWSSYRCHAEDLTDPLITEHPLFLAMADTKAARQAAYHQLLSEDLSLPEMASIRDATNKAWVLGSERFKQELATLSDRRIAALPKGRPRKQRKMESDPK
jgi:putative transposase